eukprot:TRINITY_DN4305_c0_g1_i1.p1 TRINITY_DN4305_c0_g1~~TRINITY_DN4305_c0_g1_i1.p1  ORF type:complete len:517 (+),score=46.99 TRINITY_DN4305_c0_g1_i1:543-2093(+)
MGKRRGEGEREAVTVARVVRPRRGGVESGPLPSWNSLPEDIQISIVAKVGASATCPSDLANVARSSKRLHLFCKLKEVRQVISSSTFPSFQAWCPNAHSFVKDVAKAGNVDARFFLGTVEFYHQGNRFEGIYWLAVAAESGHPAALYSLAIMHFNASGAESSDRNLAAGVLLCISAAQRGHIEALREIGHCLQDGYGVARDVVEGRRLLLEANLREFFNQAQPSLWPSASDSLTPVPPNSGVLTHLRNLQKGCASQESLEIITASQSSPKPLSASDLGNLSASLLPLASPQVLPGIPADSIRQMLTFQVPSVPQNPHRNFSPVFSKQTLELVATLREKCQASAQKQRISPGHVSPTVSATLNTLCDCLGPLLSDFGCVVPRHVPHPANLFLLEWSAHRNQSAISARTAGHISNRNLNHYSNVHSNVHSNLDSSEVKICGNALCGRPETRPHEFRCCAECSGTSYCSRGCQALDWKWGHITKCQEEAAARAWNSRVLAQARLGVPFPVHGDDEGPNE